MSAGAYIECSDCTFLLWEGKAVTHNCSHSKTIDALRLALKTATRERDEAQAGKAKWRRELDAAIELSERSREIVKAALNQPPEYFYDHHDNGEWSAEHIAHAIRCLFAERDALLSRPAPLDSRDEPRLPDGRIVSRVAAQMAKASAPAPAPSAKETR